jgi:hypothetical protein
LLALLCLAIPVGQRRGREARDAASAPPDGLSPLQRTRIEAVQREIESRGLRWRAGATDVSRLSPAEFERLLGAVVPPDEPPVALEAFRARALAAAPADLPARWDWRELSGVSAPRAQGLCGSCWAFAAAGALEALLRIYDGEDLDVSEQHVLDCNADGYGCGGGWMTAAYRLWQVDGARREADRPYCGADGQPCGDSAPAPVARVTAWTAVAPERESVQRALLLGPVATAMHVYPDFQHYVGGVYEHEGSDPINHAVLLVGWDDALGAWILKNSWGPGWGEEGFAYVRYGSCRLGSYVHRIAIPTDSPLRIHHAALADTVTDGHPLALRAVVTSLRAPLDPTVEACVDTGAGVATIAMTRLGGDAQEGTFEAALPPLRVGSRVRYLLRARDADGETVELPGAGADGPFEFRVLRRCFASDLESPDGWIAGAPEDDASGGAWEWGAPEATFGSLGRAAQPGEDHGAEGANCFVTGRAAGASAAEGDVDGGATSLVSPVLDLGGLDDATLRFRLWFTNHLGGYPWEDAFTVQGSADGGESWTDLYQTRQGVSGWRRVSVPLHEFLPLGDRWRLRFAVADRQGDSLVEALIDDLEILTATGEATLVAGPEGPGPVAGDLQIGPNPSSGPLQLRLAVREAGPSTIGIYDAAGRRVRSLWRGELPAGARTLAWDGCDDRGLPLAAGRYWVRVTAPGTSLTRALTRVR